MLKTYLQRVLGGEDLSQKEASEVMKIIMSGKGSDVQVAAMLTALRMKGESVTEITGMAKVMISMAEKIKISKRNVVDTCGTGGDMAHTFNVSTLASFVAAGAGVVIAKHGNRAVSSKCGSADVLEGLGVKVDLSPAKVGKIIDKIGIGFIFAPLFHKAMKNVIPIRKDLKVRTIFNILGPLTNPAGAKGQIIGVYDPNLTTIVAQVLRELGVKKAFVVNGAPSLDEISICGPTKISELAAGKIRVYTVRPEDFGYPMGNLEEIIGGDSVRTNVAIAKNILSGKDKGTRAQMVILNAAAAIVTSGKASTMTEAIPLAEDSLYNGKAQKKLEELIKLSNK